MLKTLVSLVSLAALASAQQVIVPENMYYSNTGSSTLTWRTTAFRFQMVYDTSHFTSQGVTGPITINRLRFRAVSGTVNAGGSVYTGVTVQMSSSPLDYAAASTTFASNRGLDNAVVYAGNVTTLPAAGTGPNTYIIDIPLTTPFVYDPTLGLDLVVEVDAPVPVPTTGVPSMACGNVVATHKSQRISAATQAATTGALSGFASVILFDFTGPGGYSTWTSALNQNFGTGCYATARSFYEENVPASSMDLSNKTLTMTPNAGGGYDVVLTPGSTLYPHGATGLALTDDALAPVTTLPFPLTHPSGTTSSMKICSNGFLWLDGTSTSASAVPTGAVFMSAVARLAPFWDDLLPDGATNVANVFYDVDPSGNTVYVTWDQVPAFTSPTNVSTFQVAIHNTGVIEYRYGACMGGTDTWVSGYSAGTGAVNPGSRDLTGTPVFSTGGPEVAGLSISGSTARIGQSLTHTISNIPANAVLSVRVLGFTQFAPPGIDLGIVGAPGCSAFVDLNGAAVNIILGTPTAVTSPFVIPNSSVWLGAVIYAQGASLVPGVNAAGLLTTNQNRLTLGNT